MLVHAHTGEVVARAVEIADSRATRRRGLLGRDGLPAGTAFIITLCKGVHTIGMRFAIDVVFIDGNGTVRKIVRNMAPRRLAFSPMASLAIESESGSLPIDTLRVGDRLYLAPAASECNVAGDPHERGAQVRRGIVPEFQH